MALTLSDLSSSSTKCQLLHFFYFLFLILCFISTIVAFAGELFNVAIANHGTYSFHWNYLEYPDGSDHTYSNGIQDNSSTGAECQDSGRAFFAFNFFAFLLSFACILFASTRVFSLHIPSFFQNPLRCLYFEMITLFMTAFWLFLSTAIFGAQCFNPFISVSSLSFPLNGSPVYLNIETTGTGFGFNITAFLLTFINIFCYLLIRADPTCHLGGNGAAGKGLIPGSDSAEYEEGFTSSTGYSYAEERDSNGVVRGYQSDV